MTRRGLVRRGMAWAIVTAVAAVGSAAAQVPKWPSERPPRPLPSHEVRFPHYEIRTLANGLRVVAVPHHEQPAVSLRLIIAAGGAEDPVNKPGVATLMAALLDQGTTTRSAEEIAAAIDDRGGALGVGAGTDLSYVNALVLREDLDFALDLVSDVTRNPAFAPEEIERQRQQMLSGLQVSRNDPDYIASVVFDRLVYGFHPYGRPSSGTPESVPAITREDLVAFHDRYFAPNNSILAIVGDITPAEAFAGAERAFNGWARQDVRLPQFGDPPPPTRRLVVVDRPDAVQTEIRVGHIAIARSSRDYMALNLAIKVLGGEGANRLHRVLRSERGLTYGASADLETLQQTGDIVAETNTRSATTGETLRLIVDEFWRLRRERVNRAELEGAQAYLAGSFPLTIETPSAIALQVLNALFYGLDLEDLQNFPERVSAVTPADVQRVAERYLKPDRLSIVLVGAADAFASQLRGAGFPEYERVPLADLDLDQTDLKRRARPDLDGDGDGDGDADGDGPAQANASSAAEVSGLRLIDRAIDAMGGLEALRSVKTLKAEATTTLAGPQGSMEAETTTFIAYPDRLRVEAQAPAGRIVQVYADGQAWLQDPRGIRAAPDALRDQFRAGLSRDLVPLLLGAHDGRARVRVLPDAQENGRRLPAVEITAAGVPPVTLRFDPESGKVVSELYTLPGPDGGSALVEERLGDYRTVDGVQIPYSAVIRREGTVVMERTVRSVELNIPLDAALFTKPS
jgi:zinc protease